MENKSIIGNSVECSLEPIVHDIGFFIGDKSGDQSTSTFQMPVFHVHPSYYEIHFVLRGSITTFTEDAIYERTAGSVLLIPPGKFHRMVFNQTGADNYFSRIFLYISDPFLEKFSHQGYSLSDHLRQIAYGSSPFLQLNPWEISKLCQSLPGIAKTQKNKSPLEILSNQLAVMQTIISLIKNFDAHSGTIQITPQETESIIPSVISYINDHLNSKLTLDTLAEHFFINKFYLAHKFKDYTQLSVYQYILSRRMLLAKELLKEDHSPSESALLCGYNNYSSFYKAFLRETGVSPLNFNE